MAEDHLDPIRNDAKAQADRRTLATAHEGWELWEGQEGDDGAG